MTSTSATTGSVTSDRIRQIVRKTGLSEFSLRVHAAMVSKAHPLRVDTLFRVVCPNREIRSLSRDELQRLAPQPSPQPLPAGAKKPIKKNDDDRRKHIVKERERELAAQGVKIAGTLSGRKKMPLQQKDLALRWEFLAWGQTSSNFHVYLYYTGPVDKGENDEALTRYENWHIVPESHLSIFHKYIADIHPYLQQTLSDVRMTRDNRQHIEYDVRYILYKWRTGAKGTRKEMLTLVNDNLVLFEPKDTLRVKEHKRRKQDEAAAAVVVRKTATKDPEVPATRKRSRSGVNVGKRSSHTRTNTTDEERPVESMNLCVEEEETDDSAQLSVAKKRRVYEVKGERWRRCPITTYQDSVRYPLGTDGITFNVEQINAMMENAVCDDQRSPISYEWDPVESLVQPLMLVNDPVLFRRQLVTTLTKKYNLCCETTDFQAQYEFLNTNEAAANDIRAACDSFTWSAVCLNLMVVPGMIPDELSIVQ